jgi:hypothetical protein
MPRRPPPQSGPGMRTVTVTRYLTPLREGGSLPAIVEADDEGLYVLKFRGAGQGRKALVAELVAGEIARALDLPVPEIVCAQLDPELARTEPDPEIQDLIRASSGLNLALDYLPGAVAFDPLAERPAADLASRVVWFDAFVGNVDRTPRNTNLLVWHRRLWLIDHGAALTFHHAWSAEDDPADVAARALRPFELVKDHVLLPCASAIAAVDTELAARLTPPVLEAIVAAVPDDWLPAEAGFADAAAQRAAYLRHFGMRLGAAPRRFVEEAVRAHAAVR